VPAAGRSGRRRCHKRGSTLIAEVTVDAYTGSEWMIGLYTMRSEHLDWI
jgi:hypothetical protein